MKAAVIGTYREDGTVLLSPVWYRERDGAFEIVVVDEGDVKLRHLRRDPRCSFTAFDVEPPFRGVEVHGEAEIVEGDVTEARREIVASYIGAEGADQWVKRRTGKPSVIVRIPAARARTWDLTPLLPD
jgi:PPOX class probable F420-dependent enzyme